MKQMRWFLLLVVMLALVLCAACSPAQEENNIDSAIGFTDMTGNQISLPAPVEKMVVLTAADCEIIYALGAEDTLVARGEYCDYPQQVLDIPSLQSGSETNLEQIIALEPDVVVMGTMDQTVEQVQALQEAGITVVCSDADDIEGTYEAIRMLGILTGKNEEAEIIVKDMQNTFAAVQQRAATAAADMDIYFEVSPLEYGLWAAGMETFMDEIAQMLGATNIFSDVSGWVEVAEEQVLDRDPDIIVTVGMSFEGQPSPAQEIMDRAGWQEVAAVTNNMVINLPNNELTRPGPRLAEAAQMICDIIYPADIQQ